ncbi:MAG: NCAIR mutase, PurE-like [Candidatus Methanohalarchaeum thermophilum]|uniref:NCAIR mutase, PurE-like n=1 Tax=Methanohalarchaeum thermophilum TaxID=1903181 RepID=A0A1Q6DUU4_METT1|nr:MAG: NCAIR mutase, PurE-like [Candidatus Methanohalarchaeum thermophilum]
MDLDDLLDDFREGEITKEELKREINLLEISELGDYAKLDTGRKRRAGTPEAILGEGKSPEEFSDIMIDMASNKGVGIGTRVSKDQLLELKNKNEDFELNWYEKASIVELRSEEYRSNRRIGKIGVISAGTADIEVAEEARVTAKLMGAETKRSYDVGVAGIHRLFPELKKQIDDGVEVLIVAAGRDGSLPPVVAGIVEVPVIGVPTSTGYGLGGNGRGALFSMLQSCSLLSVVNIDAGFTAGAFAAKILKSM